MKLSSSLLSLLTTSSLCQGIAIASHSYQRRSTVSIDATPPPTAGIPLEAFVSYSIELAFFPDYAGNLSSPNTFSNNLLNNIGNFTGTKPYIRVGGNTQDYAIFNSSLDVATLGIYNDTISPDYPTTLTIGPSFFESYATWPDTRYTHGFNLGRNSTTARQALLDSVPYACRALDDGRLLHWELGNEPDLYKTSAQGPVRPAWWNEQDYVDEWLHWSRAIRTRLATACPQLARNGSYTYYAPSFGGTSNSLDPLRTWEDGLDADKDIAVVTSHNYISGATSPGVTLQGTLMNHTSTVSSIAKQLNESHLLSALPSDIHPSTLPFILGETNSLYNQGRPGLSNTFGAALWGLDFNLYCAANKISRVHMHQGTNYRYQAWQPVDTSDTPKGTKAPYYGQIAVAAFLGDLSGEKEERARVVSVELGREEESAYAAYVGGMLKRVVVVNMMEYNATVGNNLTDAYVRPVERYVLDVPGRHGGKEVGLQRLMANGSDAVTGVTFDGVTYNWEVDEGRPVVLGNVTRGETVRVGEDGVVEVDVPYSSAVILNF